MVGVTFTYLAYLDRAGTGVFIAIVIGVMVGLGLFAGVWWAGKPLGTLNTRTWRFFRWDIRKVWALRIMLVLANILVALLITLFGP